VHGRAAAHPGEDPLLAQQPAGHLVGVLVEDVHRLVEAAPVEDAGAVGLLHVLEALDLVAHVGLDADDPDGGVVLLEAHRAAHGRARRAQGGHEHRDLALGLLPDLHGRAVVVGGEIVGVVELVDQEVLAGVGAHQLVGLLDGAVGAQGGGGEAELRAEGLEDLLAFLAGRLGEGEAQPVALGGGHQGEPDPRVAARRLEDDLVARQLAPLLGTLDHVQGGPVFHGPPGIEALELCEDFDVGVGVELADLDKRRVADRLEDPFESSLHVTPLRKKGSIVTDPGGAYLVGPAVNK